MRERRPEDWQADLAQRHPIETAVGSALGRHDDLILMQTSTASTDRLDYQLIGPGDRLVEVELKAKRQPYKGWSRLRPDLDELDLFILDELAFRKIVDVGRHAFLLVRDKPGKRWCIWNTLELGLASKTRTVRDLAVGSGRVKAKLLIDLREAGHLVDTLDEAIEVIARSVEDLDRNWHSIEPWPHGAGVTPHLRTVT